MNRRDLKTKQKLLWALCLSEESHSSMLWNIKVISEVVCQDVGNLIGIPYPRSYQTTYFLQPLKGTFPFLC